MARWFLVLVRRRMLRHTLYVGFFMAGLAPLVVGAESGSVENCVQCHQQLAHGGPTGLFNKDCVVCHASNKPGDKKHTITEPSPVLMLADAAKPTVKAQAVPAVSEKPNPMVLIAAGEFTMGTNDRLPDEGPEHKVTLPAFYIDIFEVTNQQYKQFIDASGRKSPSHFRNRTFPSGKANHPVTYVTWHDADAYCTWSGKRLPSEQEWEKAARSPDARVYPWGNDFDISKANTPQRWQVLKQQGDTMPVGSFPEGVNAYGAYDMSGNVWEWTASWYKPHPGNTRLTENYGEKYKVLKGGSWWDCSFYKCGISAPLYNRSFFLQATKNKSFGFRCAKDA